MFFAMKWNTEVPSQWVRYMHITITLEWTMKAWAYHVNYLQQLYRCAPWIICFTVIYSSRLLCKCMDLSDERQCNNMIISIATFRSHKPLHWSCLATAPPGTLVILSGAKEIFMRRTCGTNQAAFNFVASRSTQMEIFAVYQKQYYTLNGNCVTTTKSEIDLPSSGWNCKLDPGAKPAYYARQRLLLKSCLSPTLALSSSREEY